MPRNFSKNILELNLAVLFISTSGVLGRYIDMPSPVVIGLRTSFAVVLLFAFCKWKRIDLTVENKDRLTIAIGGLLLGLHWITYFYALQLSNIAIAMLSLFTYPVMTTLLEPIILKTKILKSQLALSAFVLIGIYFIAPEFDLENDSFLAICFGLISALCFAFRNIIMKSKINEYNGSALMTHQLFVIALLSIPFYFLLDTSNLYTYIPATILLAFLTTAVGHTLFLYSLKHFSAVTASIMSCVQPVYGILIGMLFLQEYPEQNTIIGGAIIIVAVLLESLRLHGVGKKHFNS